MTMAEAKPIVITGDRPKGALADDRLGYADFARLIAKSIHSFSGIEGLVLAIHGEWGSGKTSVVNMVEEALLAIQQKAKESKRILVVRFNPWWFSEQEDLTHAFFSEISANLGSKVSDKIQEGLKSVGQRVGRAKEFVLGAIELVPGAGIAKVIAQGLLSQLPTDGLTSLEVEREKLRTALREGDTQILVIIDDVDRLPADEARQIFRMVKSVADLPNVIYLLVFDREFGRRAVEEASSGDGPSWLEKIVQASFDLPPANQIDLNNMFWEGLSERLGGIDLGDKVHWGNVFHSAIAPWLKKPRDVTRLLNVVSVTWPAVDGDVNFADFVAIETMRIFEPRLFAFVRANKETLVGASGDGDASIADALMPHVSIGRMIAAKRALTRLFPRVRFGPEDLRFGATAIGVWDKERRICSPKRFDTYFAYGVSDNQMTRLELSRAIDRLQNQASFREYVEGLQKTPRRGGGTRAAALLDELGSSVYLVPINKREIAAKNLLDAADLFLSREDESDSFFATPRVWEVWGILHDLLAELPMDLRVEILSNAISSSLSLYTLSYVMRTLAREHGRYTTDEVVSAPEERRFIDISGLDRLETELLGRIQTEADNGELIKRNLLPILYHWGLLSSFDDVQAWTDRVIAADASALRLAEAATGIQRTHSSGDLVGKSSPSVNRQSLDKLLDVDQLLIRLRTIAKSGCATSVQLSIITRFEEGLDSGSDV